MSDRHAADKAWDRLAAVITPEVASAVADLFPRQLYDPQCTMEFIQYHEGQQKVVRTLLAALRARSVS